MNRYSSHIRVHRQWLLLFFLFSVPSWSTLSAQINSLMTFDVATWYDNHLAVSSEHEIYLASELKDAENNYKRGTYVVKLDSCNQVVWKRIFQKSNIALNVHDLVIMENDDLLLMGITDQKDIFLIRINPEGDILFSYRYQNSAHDFNYSLQVRENQIMIFGNNFFGGNEPTLNYILLLDENGVIIWNKNFMESISAGEALYCSDGGFLCQNGNVFYKTDATGAVEWGRSFPFIDPIDHSISNVVEIPDDGYYFTYLNQSIHYLTKIDLSGNLVWTGEGVRAEAVPGSLTLLASGDLAWVNSTTQTDGKLALSLHQFNLSGQVVEQFLLRHPDLQSVRHAETLFLPKDNTLAVFATMESEPFRDLYLRTSLSESICFLEEYYSVIPAPQVSDPTNIAVPVVNGGFSRIALPGINTRDIDFTVTSLCLENDPNLPDVIEISLPCNGTYLFESPYASLDHLWFDGSIQVQRDFSDPGTYDLLISDCTTGYPVQIRVDKAPCPCETEFPGAFSPNADNVNDQFGVIAECAFMEYQLHIFDRWGKRVFFTEDPSATWDGNYSGKGLPTDVYSWWCRYRPDDGIGTGQEILLKGEIHLLR